MQPQQQQQQQYETFTSLPKFILVGKKGANDTNLFYRNSRDVRLITSLNDELVLKNLSLIIPSLLHEKPAMKEKENNSKQVIDFESIKSYVRYFGIADLDMPLTDVLNGKTKLYSSDPEDAMQYANVDMLKLKWSQWLKNNPNLTIGEIRAQCPHFDFVCQRASELASSLAAKGLKYILFFSGCKGHRVIWLDPSLFYWVLHTDEYAKAFMQQVAMSYFTGLGCSPFFVSALDTSIFERMKGVNPNVLKHPDSLLFPFLIQDYSRMNELKLCRLTPDLELIQQIKTFWTSLPDICPLKIPWLRPIYQRTLFSTEMKEPQQQKQQQQPRKRRSSNGNTNGNSNNDNSNSYSNTSNSNSHSNSNSNSNSYSNASNSNNNYSNSDQLSDEFKQGIAKWMKQHKRNFSTEPFPSYSLKMFAKENETDPSRYLLKFNNWYHCALGKCDHSHPNDIYFLVNDTEVTQKCFSSKCSKAKKMSVYVSSAFKEQRRLDAQIASKVLKNFYKRQKRAEEKEEKIRLSNRPLSPNSCSIPSIADSLLQYPLPLNNNSIEAINAPQVELIETAEWWKFRYFETRMECKNFYLDSFKLQQQQQFEICNNLHSVVVPCDELQANYVKIKAQQLLRANTTHLFVVLYNLELKKSVEWGLLSSKQLESRCRRYYYSELYCVETRLLGRSYS